MKRTAFALVSLIILAGLPLAAQPAGAVSLDKTVASAELIRKANVSLKQLKIDIGRVEAMLGKKMEASERREYLDLMINDILFLQYCEREKISVTEAEIKQTVQQMKGQVMSSLATNPQCVDTATLTNWATTGSIPDDSFYAILSKLGVQSADLNLYVKKRLLLKKFVATKQAVLAKIERPSYEDVEAFYTENADSMKRPDVVKLAVLYVDIRGKDDAGKRKAKELAESLYSKVKGNATKFNEAVLRSLDPKSGYKGEPGYLFAKSPESQELFGQKFYDTAFSLKIGDTSGILEGVNGYHIIRLLELVPEKTLELSDPISLGEKTTVFEFIQQNLYSEKVDKALQDMLNALMKDIRAKAKIKIEDSLLSW